MSEPTKGMPGQSRLVTLRREISRLLAQAAEAQAHGAMARAEDLVAHVSRLAAEAAELEQRAKP
jgi:hypothetical protein